jgi:hypothetical protein
MKTKICQPKTDLPGHGQLPQDMQDLCLLQRYFHLVPGKLPDLPFSVRQTALAYCCL